MIQNKEAVHARHHIKIEKWLCELERARNAETLLEKAAQKAATTGNRKDLSEYLKLRRELLP